MMKQYSKYKDSGVKWIGEIPSHWETAALKRTISLINDKTSESKLPYVALEHIESYTGKLLPLSNIEPESICNKFRIGDVLFCKLRPYLTKCIIAEFDGKCTSELLILRDFIGSKRYLQYLLLSPLLISDINASTYGSKMPRANWNYIGMCNIPIPSSSEQQAIVSYLDAKVAKIDSYIATATKKIAALEELKQVTIANAVTKGINPNAPMKDSGIPWIGMVPEHWEIDKIRKHFKERRTKVSDKDYSPLSVAKAGVVPQLDDACKTDNGDNRKLVLKGDFVVNSRSDRKGSCGVSYLDGSVSLINIVLEVINMDKIYIHNLFRCFPYIEEFYRNGRGIVADLWTTRYSEMKNIFIPVPPLSEQTAIVSYIDSKVAQIEQMRAAELSQIEKLKEYKQRLISDVVTGKVKVTND